MIAFVKYHGAGNDFVMIDGRYLSGDLKQMDIARICERHFGVGADGLIILRPGNSPSVDFDMQYFNADGRESSMCGNGARCAVAFAKEIGLAGQTCVFMAYDGKHTGELISEGNVSISMLSVEQVEDRTDDIYILNTGSPHYVQFVEDASDVDVFAKGRRVRNSEEFAREGINVNFVEIQTAGSLRIRTYERGVEDITLACGTGVTAAALAYATKAGLTDGTVSVTADGGELAVSFDKDGTSGYKNIFLHGPVQRVFEGSLEV